MRACWIVVCLVAACGPNRPDATDSCGECAGVCDPVLGCVACAPNTSLCLGETSRRCEPDGSGYVDDPCDGPGEACDHDSGGCYEPCSAMTLANTYLGCEYFPTVTGNMVSNTYSFAIIIANYHPVAITGTLDGADLPLQQFEIPANSVLVKTLPWQQDLKLCNAPVWEDCRTPTRFSARANGGAYHLVTERPVAVYQFSPLEYTQPAAGEFSYTNDASLLFPVNVWGTEYRVASWRETAGSPGLLTVVASEDNTMVTITAKAATQGDATIPSFAKDEPQTIVLDRGDVAQLGTIAAGDLTGSLVSSDKPVQVIGGHYCANVPAGNSYCDHLEESMIPVRALATSYVVTPPRSDAFPNGRVQVVRVIATEADTELTFVPAQTGINTTLQRAGDFVELASSDAAFVVTGTKKILVSQYMIGQSATIGTADPAMAIAVPTEQFRTAYLFHAPTNYVTNYVDIVSSDATQLTLDGAPVTAAPTPIGTTGWMVTRLVLDDGPAGDGNHRLEATAKVGITVYGYGDYTSYWYPGGLDLTPIIL
jgi:hypothetical protein